MIEEFINIAPRKVDDTIVFNQDDYINHDPDYHFLGNLVQNPINKKIFHQFSLSDTHFWEAGKSVSAKISINGGTSYGVLFVVYDPSTTEPTEGINECGCGYDNNGRLHFFVNVRDAALGSETINELRYFYSDDDGTTISSPVVLSLPSDGLVGAWTTGKMIENNGVLLKNYYKIDESPPNFSANYLLRSVNGGQNWTTITIRQTGSHYINEADIVSLGGNKLVSLIRDELGGHNQFYSPDNGISWIDHGNIQWGETWTVKKPCKLKSFNIKGVRVIAAYHYLQSEKEVFVVYGRADQIANGTSGWDINTKLVLFIATLVGGGYGSAVHINNTLEAKGVHFEDPGLDSTDTIYFTCPTTHYQSLITELNL